MAKKDLESKLNKAVSRIDKNVKGIYDIIGDLSLKICHMIKSNKYDFLSGYRNKYERS